MKGYSYYSIFNNGHTPMLIIDSITGDIKDANRAACNFYGYPLDRLLTLKITDINTLSHQEVFEEMRKARNEERKFFRFRHKLANGEIKEVEVYSGPIHSGDEPLLFSIIHDAEYKKEMEKRIRLQQIYFQGLFENSPEAIALLDNEFRILSINKSFKKIFQYSINEVLCRDITAVLCDERFYDESTYIKDSIEKGEYIRRELLRKRKDGSLVEVSLLGFPIILNGEQVGVFAIYSDQTSINEEKRKHEQRIQMYIDQLEEARKKAEEASEFKSRFISNMTHELRTPMNGITGIIELLKETRLSDEQKEYLEMLEYSASRLSSIINNVLDISKIEAGKLELRKAKFNVNKLVNEAARYFNIQAGRKGLELNCIIGQDVPEFLVGDPDKLNQVLFNLLANAVKFTDKGYIEIDVRLAEKSDNNVKLHFCIKDTGIGIPEDKLAKVFEDFFQLETVNSRRYGGTGLGLPIAKRLVQKMGGDLAAESEYEKGSTFHFTISFPLPLLQDNVEQDIDSGYRYTRGGLSALDVLVVEDDVVNRKIIKKLLKRNGCNVALAANGEEALKVLQVRNFDVILMDIYMPVMNGFDATRSIRAKESAVGRHTPIIAMTAAAQSDEMEKYSVAGFDAYLTKPCGRERIFSTISEVLRNRHKMAKFSLDALIQRLEGDYVLVKEIIAEVTSSAYESELFGGIDSCLRNGDYERLCNHIHKFKGSLSHFGADSIDKALSEIKERCRTGDFSEMEVLCGRIKQEYTALKSFLLSCHIA